MFPLPSSELVFPETLPMGWLDTSIPCHPPFLTRGRLEISGEIFTVSNQGEVPMASVHRGEGWLKHLGIIDCRKQPSGPGPILPKGPRCRALENLGEEISQAFCPASPAPVVAMATSPAVGLGSRRCYVKSMEQTGILWKHDLIKDNWQESGPAIGLPHQATTAELLVERAGR